MDHVWAKYYHGAFRKHTHQLLAWGYEDARPKIDKNKQEEEITGFLYEAMKDRLSDAKTPSAFDRLDVINEAPQKSLHRTGKRRQRLDIVFVSSKVKPRPEFVFEAKRLAKSTNTIGDYVGTEGLQCFTSGEYAAEYPAAGMIGYIQTDTAQYWYKELTRRFDNDTNQECRVVQKLSPLTIISTLDNEWISSHSRNGNTTIDILHILLDCC